MLEKTLEIPLDLQEIKLVNPKQNQHWRSTGSTDAETEAAMIWPPDVKSQLIRKDHDSGKDWRQEEKGTTEDEIVGWHHWLDGHEFEQTMGDDEWQGNLVCCSPQGCKESDMTERLINNKDFNSTWTKNFQMYKLDLQKGQEPEIKLPTSIGL